MPDYRGDQLSMIPLATPEAPTLSVRGTSGETTYGYKVVAKKGTVPTDASEEETTVDGPATLTPANHIRITPPYVAGATGFDIYRTTGGGDQGKIGSIAPRNQGTTQVRYFVDSGLSADDTEAPTVNATGQMSAGGVVMMTGLPTADPLVVGQLWNDSGTLKVSAGD
jgi:hypothetical protein